MNHPVPAWLRDTGGESLNQGLLARRAAWTPRTQGGARTLAADAPPTLPEVQALRDAFEVLADDVRALATLVQALRGALVAVGAVKGGL